MKIDRPGMRKMNEGDREAVLTMMRKFYSSDAVMSDGSEEIFNNDIEACVSDSPYAEGFVFTDSNGKIGGYAMIAHSYSTEFGKRCVWIEDLFLGEDLRGQGLASLFFDYIADEYPEAVHRLEAEYENKHALNVYRRKGFDEIHYMEMIRNRQADSVE